MASAQVLPNSRKLGHLEAGKKKLEEFRKKKAEERAKKAASTGQLISADEVEYEQVSQKYEHVRDGGKTATDIDSYGLNIPSENNAVNSSHSIEILSSNRTHGSTPVFVDSNYDSYGESVQIAANEVPKLYGSSPYTELANGYYDQWKESSELSHKKDTKIETSGGNGTNEFDAFNPVKASSSLDTSINNSSFHSFFKSPPGEDRNSSKVHSHPETSFGSSLSISENTEIVSGQNSLGFPSTSANTSGLYKDTSSGVELSFPGSLNKNNASDFGRGGKAADSTGHSLNVDSAHWHLRQASYKDSSFDYKATQYEHPIASTGFGTNSAWSRPSFLDSLGVSRGSSVANVPSAEPEKASTPGSFDISKAQTTEVPLSSSFAQRFPEFNTADQSLKSFIPDFKSDKELSMNSMVSSNDGKQLEPSGDHHVQRDHWLFTSNKDDDFVALEQHIEDLTQEKFSLQRALETSRTLAESLAAENSSLTESYNLQGKIVSQLKSDMERLQDEIKAQLLAIESVRSEYMNAQLECNAADERAKILTSEIIFLEEKALRLRSNELKLEKQLENLNSEITSYKRKVSIMEKERQDFQSTIDALQEEKKLLQSKLRRVSTNEKVDSKKTSTGRDVSTSTEDLGVEPFSLIDGETSSVDRMLNNTINPVHDSARMAPSTDASTSSLVPDDASSHIPHDQLRMIENISSLMSELALEKEELVGALRIESSNCDKLKDVNKDLSQKLEAQTQRLELLTAQRMANESFLARPIDTHSIQDTTEYTDEGDEVVERVLGWIMKLFPGGPSKRRTSKLL